MSLSKLLFTEDRFDFFTSCLPDTGIYLRNYMNLLTDGLWLHFVMTSLNVCCWPEI